MKMIHKHDIYFSPHSTEAHSLVMQIADYCNKRGIWYKISESTLGIGIVYGGNVGYVIDADSKTENSSENPNNCEPRTDCGDFADRLAYERGVKHAWGVAQKAFDSTLTFYEAEDVAKQIDKDINVRSKDEPQTDCAWR